MAIITWFLVAVTILNTKSILSDIGIYISVSQSTIRHNKSEKFKVI